MSARAVTGKAWRMGLLGDSGQAGTWKVIRETRGEESLLHPGLLGRTVLLPEVPDSAENRAEQERVLPASVPVGDRGEVEGSVTWEGGQTMVYYKIERIWNHCMGAEEKRVKVSPCEPCCSVFPADQPRIPAPPHSLPWPWPLGLSEPWHRAGSEKEAWEREAGAEPRAGLLNPWRVSPF